jgi:ribosome maturation factor RimP
MNIQTINILVEKGLKELSLSDTFLVESRISGNKIEIFLDSDTGITFDTCQRVSRWIEADLDSNGSFGENYTLEISSPGVGSPLRLLRQYPKNIGRIIEVKTLEKTIRGTLTKIDEDHIFVEYQTKIKEGKKNKKIIVTDEIIFDKILESKIKIKF